MPHTMGIEQMVDEKCALVTGGSKGIGLAIAQKLIEQGYFVIIMARDQQGISQAVKLLGRNVHGVSAHLNDYKSISDALHTVQQRYDIVIDNAGAMWLGAIDETSPTIIQQVANNQLLTANFLKAVTPYIFSSTIGLHISTQAVRPQGTDHPLGWYDGNAVYGPAKQAQRLTAISMAHECGYTMKVLHPGLVDTPGLDNAMSVSMKAMLKDAPRLTPNEVAQATWDLLQSNHLYADITAGNEIHYFDTLQ